MLEYQITLLQKAVIGKSDIDLLVWKPNKHSELRHLFVWIVPSQTKRFLGWRYRELGIRVWCWHVFTWQQGGMFLCSNSFGSTESEYEDYSTTATNDLSTVLSSTKFRSRLVLLVDKKLNWSELKRNWIEVNCPIPFMNKEDRFSLIGATTPIVPIRSLSVISVIYLHRIFVCFGLPRLVMSMKFPLF